MEDYICQNCGVLETLMQKPDSGFCVDCHYESALARSIDARVGWEPETFGPPDGEPQQEWNPTWDRQL